MIWIPTKVVVGQGQIDKAVVECGAAVVGKIVWQTYLVLSNGDSNGYWTVSWDTEVLVRNIESSASLRSKQTKSSSIALIFRITRQLGTDIRKRRLE